ncbi:hypothetical protein GCM10029964_087440 [Kibdelosporangium lantanae]
MVDDRVAEMGCDQQEAAAGVVQCACEQFAVLEGGDGVHSECGKLGASRRAVVWSGISAWDGGAGRGVVGSFCRLRTASYGAAAGDARATLARRRVRSL